MFNHGTHPTKQVFPLSRVFLANLVLGHWGTLQLFDGICTLSKSVKTWNPLPLCIHPFIPLLSWCHWHNMQLPMSLTCYCVMLQWHHTKPPTWPYDALMMSCSFWWETHAHVSLCWSRSPSLGACPLGHSCSPYFHGVTNCDPRCTPWHVLT